MCMSMLRKGVERVTDGEAYLKVMEYIWDIGYTWFGRGRL